MPRARTNEPTYAECLAIIEAGVRDDDGGYTIIEGPGMNAPTFLACGALLPTEPHPEGGIITYTPEHGTPAYHAKLARELSKVRFGARGTMRHFPAEAMRHLRLAAREDDREGDDKPEWSEPMSKAEASRRINRSEKARSRALDIEGMQYKPVADRKVIVRLDTLDAATRARMETPFKKV